MKNGRSLLNCHPGRQNGDSTLPKILNTSPEKDDRIDPEGQNVAAQDGIPLTTFVAPEEQQLHTSGE